MIAVRPVLLLGSVAIAALLAGGAWAAEGSAIDQAVEAARQQAAEQPDDSEPTPTGRILGRAPAPPPPDLGLNAPAAAPAPEDSIVEWLPWRRRPGRVETYPDRDPQENPGAVNAPPPEAFPTDHFPIPDRWRLADQFGVRDNWFDPYNQNSFKGDRPIPGTEDRFLVFTGVMDTVIEPRSFPVPVGVQTTSGSGSNDVFGRADSLVASQTFIAGLAFIEGSTAFKPPDFEARVTLAFNYNYADISERRILSVKPSRDTEREDWFVGIQEAFVDYHLRNVSDRYDFDSIRVGIQPFNADFRGFLFQDNQLGVRLFGNRDNNRWQYNLAFFWRVEKDTNSGLNDVTQNLRDDQLFVANLYRQDFPVPGMTSQVTAVYNRNDEADDIQVDDNGFPVRPALIGNLRPRDYDVLYLGYSADGRIGRLNLSGSLYGAVGEDRNSIFTSKPADIRAWFAALEPSIDFDWVRLRGSFLYASGDDDPYDNVEKGFDAIFENPQFAGADTSYWIRQSIPFAGGGRAVGVNGRNGILNSLRSSKEEGQSNFNNPGTMLVGLGADFDVTPQVRLTGNINHLWFDDTITVQVLRNEGSIPKELGLDVSVGAVWRPWMTQNIVVRASGALFEPGDGFGDLFTNSERDDRYYSILLNATLAF
ncbi:hypothetical protein [Caulobacter sp. NIBR1757]|uniref:hypothetical protein n=1 Tax=Caulobacter sp. NIBR1757 TaxID=3016000 RepID=UPI0022F04F84|nr:hypothetical protein [Caulobacter sp. NIBR1757]WGM40736.1 hypothetical protein AMEJIAPC_03683 [Caulobacter sp. NIBR1757]